MPSFEEEAMNRVRQMQRRMPFGGREPSREPPKPSFPQPDLQPPAPKPEHSVRNETNAVPAAPPDMNTQPPAEQNGENLVSMMFQNKEQSLILLLLVLLMEEHSDPSVLLALMYLLM